jgi:DNA-binding transcriptional regulator YbjK
MLQLSAAGKDALIEEYTAAYKELQQENAQLLKTLGICQAECTRLLLENRAAEERWQLLSKQYMKQASKLERLKRALALYEASDKLVYRNEDIDDGC